jgi:DNA modification methylase
MRTVEHGYVDSEENALHCYSVLATESFRITTEQAHLYVFCDPERFLGIREMFAAAGWTCFRTPLIWYKKHGARAPWPQEGPQRKYETILYAVKGKRPVTKMAGDVLEFGPDSNLGHGAQKPVALYRELLLRSVRPGDRVFDPFAGTGPIFEAANDLKCIATGIELDQGNFGIIVKRIQGLKTGETILSELEAADIGG